MSCAEPAARTRVALVDLGDTLAECTPALDAALPDTVDARQDDSRRLELLRTPGFWRKLAPRQLGMSLLGLLRESGFEVTVLTKGPRDALHVWSEKVAWCREFLPGVPVVVADDKTQVCADVFVDDWLPYVERWHRRWPDALVIVPAQPWNAGFATGPRRLRDEGDDRAAIVAALQRVAAGGFQVPREP